MGIEWVPVHGTNLVGGLVLAAFAVLVALVPPRSRVQIGFGVFAGAFGFVTAYANLVMMSAPGDPLVLATPPVAAVAAAIAVAGLLVLWREMPVPLERSERRLLVPVALFTAPGVVAAAFLSRNVHVLADGAGNSAPLVALAPFWWAFWLGLLLLLVLRYLRPDAHPEVVRQAPMLSAGLVLYVGVNARWAGPIHSPGMRVMGAIALVGVLVLAAAWLVAASRGPNPRACRNVAWIALGSALVGFASDAAGGQRGLVGIDGVARVATVAFLSVAILRHQALGIHRKLRLGISRSTVAASFIAVFFVVSEGAQAAFSGFAESELLGVLAAGLLVFFIAPLQRAADRLAERAVPSAATRPAGVEASFRQAVRWALRDGDLSADEERALFVLAGDLGVSPRRAIELREEEEATRRAPRVEAH